MEVAGLDVVLVEADADVRRLDLHELREGILEPPSDRDRPADGRLVGGKFLPAERARRVDARPRLVDDHVAHVERRQLASHEFGHERLGLTSGGAVADRDDRAVVGRDHFDDLLRGCFPLLLLPDDVQHGMLERRAPLVDHGGLAAALEARIEREHATPRDGRLQEEVAKIAGEDLHGVRLAEVGHLAADLPLEARHHQPRECVAGAAPQEVAMRMVDGHEQLLGHRLQFVDRPLDPHLEQPRPLATVDRQDTVRWHPTDGLRKREVITVVPLILGEGLALGLHPLAREFCGAVQDVAETLPQLRPGAEVFGDDVPHAEQHVGHRGDLRRLVDEIDGPAIEVGGNRIGQENLAGERLEFPLAGNLRERELAGLEGEVEVFELLGVAGSMDPGLEVGRQPALPLDRPQHGLLAVGELPGPADGLGDPPDVLLIEATGLVAPVASDEGDRIAGVEQTDDGLDAGRIQPEAPGDRAKVDDGSDRGGSHQMASPCPAGYRRTAHFSCSIQSTGEVSRAAIGSGTDARI